MTKKELLDAIKGVPDDAEITFAETEAYAVSLFDRSYHETPYTSEAMYIHLWSEYEING